MSFEDDAMKQRVKQIETTNCIKYLNNGTGYP